MASFFRSVDWTVVVMLVSFFGHSVGLLLWWPQFGVKFCFGLLGWIVVALVASFFLVRLVDCYCCGLGSALTFCFIVVLICHSFASVGC